MDMDDPVLGFFHEWAKRIAGDDNLIVICLQKGRVDLPKNIRVFSLGKENGENNIKYIIRFYYFIFRFINKYDTVFVHMNQEYVLLGGVFWRIFGKRVMMWRNHPSGGFLTKIAILFSNRVFCTSKTSFTARFKKTRIMPVGVNTEKDFVLTDSLDRPQNTILSLGRISPVKNIHTILESFAKIRKEFPDAKLTIAGDPIPREIDLKYRESLSSLETGLGLSGEVLWTGAVSPKDAKKYYISNDVFINATDPGSFDKTIIEAEFYGAITLVCQDIWSGTKYENLAKLLYFKHGDVDDLSTKIKNILSLDQEQKNKIRYNLNKFVVECHSLDALISAIIEESQK